MQNKEWTLKMGRKTHQTAYKGRTIWITSNVPTKTLKIWKAWKDILQILKEKKLPTYTTKLSKSIVIIERETKLSMIKTKATIENTS